MATREENLKKINEELENLEQMSDEELEKVAGGGYHSIVNPNQEKQIQKPEIIGAGKK